MFNKNSYKFLQALKDNNNREWFAENKQWYEQSRSDFESLVAQIIQALSSFEPEMRYLEPKKCIFRIYRDTRFSLDKTPYKTHFGAVFTPPRLSKSSGYYLHIDPAVEILATTPFPHPDVPYYHISNKPIAMPVIWTKYWGNGRVFYSSLGHHDDVFDVPEAGKLMKNGMLWAAAGKEYAVKNNLTTERFENTAKMF